MIISPKIIYPIISITSDVEANGYPLPDEDIVIPQHMSGVSAEDFLKEFKAGVDAEMGE